MPKVRASLVIRLSLAGALLLAAAVVYPLAVSHFADLRAQRAERRDFVVASETDQRLIVRSILAREIDDKSLCEPGRSCPRHPVYFDRQSAVLLSTDDPEAYQPYELRTVGTYDLLADRTDPSTPLALRELLGRLARSRAYNSDPRQQHVTYAEDPKELPVLGEAESCEASNHARLVRTSSAAVQNSEGLALVLVATTFCDGSGSWRVAELERKGLEWMVVEIH